MTEQTARTMIEMLRRHYLPESKQPGGIFAPEIQAPGGSLRRADLIWQGVTAGSGHELIGHEVKVTRADLLAELADPTKSDAWMRYCDRWYLVVPSPRLIDGLDLPETWGVLTPPSGRRTRSATIAVRAPKLKPVEQSPAFLTLATWLHWRLHHEQTNHANEKRSHERDRAELQQLRAMVPNTHAAKERSAEDALIKKIIDGIGWDGEGLGSWRHELDVDDVVAALKDTSALRTAEQTIQSRMTYLRDEAKRLTGDLDRMLANGKKATQ